MLMENNQRERSMADILKGRGFSSPVMENNHRERSMADIMKRGDFSSPGMAPNEAQISPATPLRPMARKRKLVFDDEPLLPPKQTQPAARQWLGSSTEPSSHKNYWFGPPLNPPSAAEHTTGVNENSPPRILPHQQSHYRSTNEKSSDPDGILGLNTAKDADALLRNTQRLFNAVNRSVCGIPNANVSIPNANLGYANYHQINPGGSICLNGWSRPFYPYCSPFNGYPYGILGPQYLHSAPYQPHQQTFTSLLNNGCSLAPETPEKNIQTERLYKRQFVGLDSDERVLVQENKLDTPEKSNQHEKLLKSQSSDERVDVQEKQQEIISSNTFATVEGTAECRDVSILPPLIDPLSVTVQTPTKNNDHQLAAEGEQEIGGIDLNITPPPQKPKRKKHRPRVMPDPAKRSKPKNNEQPGAETNFPANESSPLVKKPTNHDKGTPQKLRTDVSVSVDEIANGTAAGYRETCSFLEGFSQHQPAVIHQDELHISSLRTQEVAEKLGQRGSILSPMKRAFRENYKTLARKKELFSEKAQPKFNKQKGNKGLSNKHLLGDETDTAPKGHQLLRNSVCTHIHSIHGSQSSASHLYPRENLLDPMDMIIARLRLLQLSETEVGNSELVPYLGNRDMVPYEGPFDPLKKRKHRPKVDLDAETNRVWRLLMGKASEEDKQAADDEEKRRKLEEEREIFRGRVDSFIARMRLVQGDRRFSQWKGSVVDSIVGAFLTQNVSDHLSSSAFIAMASRFPPVEKNDGTTSDSNDLVESELDKEKVIEDVSYVVQFPVQALTEQTPGQSSVSNEIDELNEENLKEITNCGESFASNRLGEKGSSSQVMNSTNGSESNSDIGEQTNQGDWIHTINDTHSFTELLREVENRTLWGLTTFEKQHDLISITTDPSLDVPPIHDIYNSKPLRTAIPSSENFDHSETGLEAAQDHMIDFLGRNPKEKDHHCNVSSTQGSSLIEDSMNAAATLWSLAQKENSTLHSECLNTPEGQVIEASELVQSSSPQDSCLQPGVSSELAQSSTTPKEIEAIEDFGLEVPSHLNDGKSIAQKVPSRRISGIARANIEMNHVSNKQTVDWQSVRKKAPVFCNDCSGVKQERDPNTMDAMNWEAVRCAKVDEIADTIKERGMNNILAGRIKAFLERLHTELGCIDLEWLRDIPPDDAKDFLLSVRGLGLKSVECIRLLSLQHLAFPVDTNVGRICVRLGWVPIMPLPESLQLHLLELYPVQANIQKYIWPRLCMLDQRTLYELHYQMITFGKVFCTKSKPNCNACPMRAECKHFASAFASARLTLQGPQENSCSVENPPCSPAVLPLPQQELKMEIPSKAIPLQLAESSHQEHNCEPIIEEPATPEPECIESSDVVNEWTYTDPDEIPVIKLNLDELSYNIQQICKSNMQDVDVSKALIMLSPQDASIPAPKLKYVHRLRTEHRVYEIPDNHPLLRGYEDRQPDDPSPYLLAIWTPGETPESTGEEEQCCSPETLDNHPCNQESLSTCVSNRENNEHTVKATMMIPCRTAMRGNFPLNGTYFQHNEVFADHETSLNPVDVPRSWIWNLERRTVLIGTSIPTIFKGLTTREIQCCFWQGFVCVRAFDRNVRAPRPLVPRLHSPASKLIKTPTQQPRKNL